MKYIINLNDVQYIVEIVDSTATLIEKSRDSKSDTACENTDIGNVPDFVFGEKSDVSSITIETPLPGRVISVNVENGSLVKRGDILMVIESMKMENSIISDYDGIIVDLNVREGDFVKMHSYLMKIDIAYK